jgi:hypothetical protein
MTDDIPADVATQGSAPTAPNPSTKPAARTKKAAATEKADRPTRSKSKSTTKAKTTPKTTPKSSPNSALQEDPEPGPSSSDPSSASSSSEDDGGSDKSDPEEYEDEPLYHPFKSAADPFSTEWYRTKTRGHIEENLQVPGTHRNLFPRPFVIRHADFNRTLANCSTGAKQEAEVLYTATVFVGRQLNRSHEFLEEHPKTPRETRDHLEVCWLFNLGIYEFLLARLDIIEGLQGDAQAQALAEIQQTRVRPLLGRGSISAERYQIYLLADTRAKVAAATSRKPRHINNSRGSASAGGSKNSTKPKNTKSKSPGTNRK